MLVQFKLRSLSLLRFVCLLPPCFVQDLQADPHVLPPKSVSPAGSENANKNSDAELAALANEIHQSGCLFDGHNDVPWRVRQLGGGSFDKVDIAQPQPRMHTDIPRLARSGLKAQFWSVYVPAKTQATGTALVQTLEQIEIVRQMIRRYPETFELALTSGDVRRIVASGKIASLIGVEGGHSLEESLFTLQQLFDRGARYLTLTHSQSLSWADSSAGEPISHGLSPFGEKVIEEMNRLGMLVDLSHVSQETMHHALRVTKAPVIFSHSSARAICDHPRNVPDDVLKKVAANGGVVMINFYSDFIVPKERRQTDPDDLGTLSDVVDHIEHVVRVAGIDHVGIGSDYDGIARLPVGLEDVTTYPALTLELVKRGYNREEIHKILGENVLRVMTQAEAVARSLTEESSADVP